MKCEDIHHSHAFQVDISYKTDIDFVAWLKARKYGHFPRIPYPSWNVSSMFIRTYIFYNFYIIDLFTELRVGVESSCADFVIRPYGYVWFAVI